LFNMGALPGSSPLEIINCVITANSAPIGGGTYNDGVLSVTRSTLSANEASQSGGGIWNRQSLTVQESTFANNRAPLGGGLASGGGEAALINNTFSANTANEAGGAIFLAPPADETTPAGIVQASHVTIAFNSAPAGGGIAIGGGTFKIKNSILQKNTPGADCQDSAGGFSSLGENMDSDGSCAGFTLTDDALLDALANNGGPTETHALKAGSPAIDAAADCITLGGSTLTEDQRGQPRPGGFACDLGAYEDKIGLPAPKSPRVVFKQPLDCRLLPASNSNAITSFQPNDSAEVVGRNINLTWYQVAPQGLEQLCWVWVGGVDLVGDLNQVEIIASTAPAEEEEEQQPAQSGCTVWNQNKVLVCQVPCPPNAVPGDPCTP